MTQSERVAAIVKVGFTERQARFLVLVMLYSGVCLLRQYSAVAGIVHGQKTCNLFAKLVSRRFATAYACRHNRGHVYHVHHKALYRAVAETDSRHRDDHHDYEDEVKRLDIEEQVYRERQLALALALELYGTSSPPFSWFSWQSVSPLLGGNHNQYNKAHQFGRGAQFRRATIRAGQAPSA